MLAKQYVATLAADGPAKHHDDRPGLAVPARQWGKFQRFAMMRRCSKKAVAEVSAPLFASWSTPLSAGLAIPGESDVSHVEWAIQDSNL
ncbi:MAG: hypothetical protein WD534_14410 [Phycisphaeraceae bacterium]